MQIREWAKLVLRCGQRNNRLSRSGQRGVKGRGNHSHWTVIPEQSVYVTRGWKVGTRCNTQPCIVERYSWHLSNLMNQCHPNAFHKKKKMTGLRECGIEQMLGQEETNYKMFPGIMHLIFLTLCSYKCILHSLSEVCVLINSPGCIIFFKCASVQVNSHGWLHQ